MVIQRRSHPCDQEQTGRTAALAPQVFEPLDGARLYLAAAEEECCVLLLEGVNTSSPKF
jgi:hypothetical protein